MDSEYKITAVREGNGKEVGHAIFTCVTPEGKEFDVRPKGSSEQRKKMWEDRTTLIGKLATVKYFETSEEGIPRFPVCLSIRVILS